MFNEVENLQNSLFGVQNSFDKIMQFQEEKRQLENSKDPAHRLVKIEKAKKFQYCKSLGLRFKYSVRIYCLQASNSWKML